MTELFGISVDVLLGQFLLGLINGAFYSMLSLGFAIIFGLLNVINFAHGVQYMMGAFCAWMLLSYAGVGFWLSLIAAPLVIGGMGIAIERFLLRRLYGFDHLYGLLLTFGIALLAEGLFRKAYGSAGQPYPIPALLQGGWELGFMYLPVYRGWVLLSSLVLCLGVWLLTDYTRLGAYLRAATENAQLVQAFGINVPRMITVTYALGAALAAAAGVLAAPIYQVAPQMGSDLMIVVFAVVVIGGMGSIVGSVATGFGLGVVEGLTKLFYPAASTTAIFAIMAIVLIVKPSGLFGQEK